MNRLLFLSSLYTWLLSSFTDFTGTLKTLKALPKPTRRREVAEYKAMRKTLYKKLAIHSAMILIVIVIALLIVLLIAKLAAWIISQLQDLWYSSLTVKAFVIILCLVIGGGLLTLLYAKISGFTAMTATPPADLITTWKFLQGNLYMIFDRIATPMRLVPPSSYDDLAPTGAKYYKQRFTDIYVYTVLKSGEVDTSVLFNVLEAELRKYQNEGRLGSLGEFNLQGALIGGVLVIDVADTGQYIKIELALTDKNAYDLYSRRKASRKMKATITDKSDDEI